MFPWSELGGLVLPSSYINEDVLECDEVGKLVLPVFVKRSFYNDLKKHKIRRTTLLRVEKENLLVRIFVYFENFFLTIDALYMTIPLLKNWLIFNNFFRQNFKNKNWM